MAEIASPAAKKFYELLVSQLKGEMSMHAALKSIANEVPEAKEAIEAMAAEAWEGRSIAPAMSRFPKIFSANDVQLVQQGERDGCLVKNLESLAR